MVQQMERFSGSSGAGQGAVQAHGEPSSARTEVLASAYATLT